MAESSTPAWVLYVAIAATLVVLALLGAVLLKSRPFRNGDVFVASRLTRGNRIFPTQVGIGPTAVTQYKPQWFGREEQSIHGSHVASVTIDTGVMFSNVIIETSGGSEPIVCHGHTKTDAARMKELIEAMQNQLLRRRALRLGCSRNGGAWRGRPRPARSAPRPSSWRRPSAATVTVSCRPPNSTPGR